MHYWDCFLFCLDFLCVLYSSHLTYVPFIIRKTHDFKTEHSERLSEFRLLKKCMHLPWLKIEEYTVKNISFASLCLGNGFGFLGDRMVQSERHKSNFIIALIHLVVSVHLLCNPFLHHWFEIPFSSETHSNIYLFTVVYSDPFACLSTHVPVTCGLITLTWWSLKI